MHFARFCLAFLIAASFCAAEDSSPTFNRDIAPIIFQNCSACHHPKGSGPFSLLDYPSVAKRARQIAEVTEDRFMPPWKPDSGYGPELMHSRRLDDDAIHLLAKWYESGAPEGDEPLAMDPPAFKDGWQLGEPDLVVTCEIPFMLPAEGKDVFRNLVIPIPLSSPRYVRAVEFKANNPKVVHHAVLQFDRTMVSQLRDQEDPEIGFDGMESSGAVNPDGHFIGWTPGQEPYEVYPGTAWRLDPNTSLVAQLHLLPSGKIEPVIPSIAFYFSDQPPERESFVIRIKSDDIDIPAGKSNYLVEKRFTLPVDVELLRLYPHAHYLGKDLKIFARQPSGKELPLFRIGDWDFNWQSDYRLVEPFSIPAGSDIVMRYLYDNSEDNIRNPNTPPKRVTYGWNSTDEMGEVSLQVLTRSREDMLTLQSGYFSYAIAAEPYNPFIHNNLGYILAEMGRKAEAADAYRKAIELKPDFPVAHNNLGVQYAEANLYSLAAKEFESAIEIAPDYAEAFHNLGSVLLEQGKLDAARREFSSALEIRPELDMTRAMVANIDLSRNDLEPAITNYSVLLNNGYDESNTRIRLASALLAAGKLDEAGPLYDEALKLDPTSADALYGAGVLNFSNKDFEAAYGHFQNLVSHDASSLRGHIQLGRTLIALDRRDEAISVSSQALELAKEQEGNYRRLLIHYKTGTELEVLALALWEGSESPEAKRLYVKAIETVAREGNPQEAEEMARRGRVIFKLDP